MVVFAGRPDERESSLAEVLRLLGFEVTAVDTQIGGAAHDVLRPEVARWLLDRAAAGEWDAVFIATPCSSYSVAHEPQLRSRSRGVAGVSPMPPEWARYVEEHNQLAEFTAALALAAHATGAAWAIENPADVGLRGSVAWWPAHHDHAPLWLQPCIVRLAEATGARTQTFAQCSFGAQARKWTSIMASSALVPHLEPLSRCGCAHGLDGHAERAYGYDDAGRSRAAAAAVYPPALDQFLGGALRAAAEQSHETRAAEARAASAGGRIAHGPQLAPQICAACDVARAEPARFASLRNRQRAADADVRLEPLPGSLGAPPRASRPRRRAAPRGRPLVRDGGLRAWRVGERPPASQLESLEPPSGPIHIAQLYKPGVYEDVVERWLERADEAASAIAKRRAGADVSIPVVPTVTITQDQQPLWARGVVYDCSDKDNCVPVERSDRDTVFPGRKQIDRAALRDVAERLHWADHDIVGQAGEGGVETRSTCEKITVLAFHHVGLLDELEAAEAAVAADLEQEWVAAPVRHLPFVPVRLLPRNCVMQSRTRVLEDGSVEHYQKPRITTDASHGGIDAVNAGVADGERSIELPLAQQHARAVAIVDTATCRPGEPRSTSRDRARAVPYVVDAESAYRYVQVQRDCWWCQCFVWWGAGGRAGICVDRRLTFGGAYAPNRFERISTLAAAHIQSLQTEFDAEHPFPAEAVAWTGERRQRQADGSLPTGEAQLSPKHLQVYLASQRLDPRTRAQDQDQPQTA